MTTTAPLAPGTLPAPGTKSTAALSTHDLIELAVARLIEDPAALPTVDEIRASLDAHVADRPLTVAETAELTGVSGHTLRYYERIGLLTVPRDVAGNRRYDDAALQRVVFLARMRASGMPIHLLQRYVGLVDEGAAESFGERLDLMRSHRAELARRIAELQIALAITDYKIATYAAPEPADVQAVVRGEGRADAEARA